MEVFVLTELIPSLTRRNKTKKGDVKLFMIHERFIAFYSILGDGSITKEEFSNALMSKFNASQEQASKVFSKVDKDGSGDISLDEIANLFTDMDTDG